MTLLGTNTLSKNVGGSIERSIVGLVIFWQISWFYGFHSYVVVAATLVPLTLISCQIPSTLHFSLCLGLMRLLRLSSRHRTASFPRSRRLSRS